MSKPLPFTEAFVRRVIAAVRNAGLEIYAVTVGTDGSITVHQQLQPAATSPPDQTEIDRWTPEV